MSQPDLTRHEPPGGEPKLKYITRATFLPCPVAKMAEARFDRRPFGLFEWIPRSAATRLKLRHQPAGETFVLQPNFHVAAGGCHSLRR